MRRNRVKKNRGIAKKFFSKNSGITLIALIITIIVMLILAGVSLSAIIGDNGIINRAKEAKERARIEDARERIAIEVIGSIDTNGSLDFNKLKDNLTNNLGIETGHMGNSLPTETFYLDDLNFYIDEELNVIYGISDTPDKVVLAETVEPTNYGDYVDYPIDLNGDGDTTNDWKIFYDNGERVFIIAADYVPNTSSYLNISGAGMTAEAMDTYNLYWNSVPESQRVTQATLFGQTLWTDYSTNRNGKCVSTMLNNDNWTGFVDTSYADYAVGGPTIEMWVASYNEKGYTELYCNKTNEYGYYVANTSSPVRSDYILSSDDNTGYGDKLYFSHQAVVSNSCWGYWLASPSCGGSEFLMSVGCEGIVGYSGYGGGGIGVRPVVALKSGLVAGQNSDEIWELVPNNDDTGTGDTGAGDDEGGSGTGDTGTRTPIAEAVEPTNYGDYVDYPIDLNGDGDTTNDWKIFYDNGERVFIIAADYVPNTSSYLNISGAGMTAHATYTYSLYWNSVPAAQSVTQGVLFGQTLWTDYSTNNNAKCVSTMLNNNNWTGFVNTTYADYAVGGPTIEMWVASYNAKGYTDLYCNNTNNVGYYVGNTSTPTSSSYDLSSDANTGYGDTLYFPHQASVSSCNGYWLASPSAHSSSGVMRVNCYGYVNIIGYSNYSVGVRPVVSLKSGVTATQGENGIWNLLN